MFGERELYEAEAGGEVVVLEPNGFPKLRLSRRKLPDPLPGLAHIIMQFWVGAVLLQQPLIIFHCGANRLGLPALESEVGANPERLLILRGLF
jgi:hypothetical protein